MALSYAILAALGRGPMHGYAVRAALQDALGLLRPVNHGQVYATLTRLASQGAIEVTDAEPRSGRRVESRRYARTERGARRLEAWLRRPIPMVAPRGELVVKLAIAAGSDDRELLRGFLSRQRAACAALAATCRDDLEARRSDADPVRRLARGAALALLEADVEWLAEVSDALLPREIEAPPDCTPAAHPSCARTASRSCRSLR